MYQKKKEKRSFRRWLGRFFDHVGKFPVKREPSEAEIMKVLMRMDKSNPKLRQQNIYDARFAQLVPFLHKYEGALNFLDTYGHVCDTYFSKLKDADKNIELQRNFCKVVYAKRLDKYFAKYRNLLFYYLSSWDLLPEVKKEIFCDEKKYAAVIFMYESVRGK